MHKRHHLGDIGRTALAGMLLAVFAAASHAASFTPGNLVVYRIGDGTATLTNNGNAVFLDEYTPNGTLLQSIPLPTTAGSAPLTNPLIASADVSEGMLARSVDGQYILLAGYASSLGGSTALASTSATAVPRTVGRVKYDGTIDTSTALTDMSSQNNVRSATSTDGTDIWVGGASSTSGGIHYTTLGSTTSTQLFSTIPKGVRQANIFGGQLYFDSNATGFLNVSMVGAGIPTTGGQTGTELPGLPDIAGNDGYFFADLGDGHGLATLYVANDSLGEILKYCLVSGSWTDSGTITAAGVHGVTAVASEGVVTLYATGTTGSDGTLYTFTDTTGYNGTVSGTATTLTTAPTNEAFRGVAQAPVASGSAPTPTATIALTVTPAVTDTATPSVTSTSTPPPTNTPSADDCCQCEGPVNVCGPPANNSCGDCLVVFHAACSGTTGLCVTFTQTPTLTASPSPSSTPTLAPTEAGTETPGDTPTATPTDTPMPTPTETAAPNPTSTSTETPTYTATATDTPTDTPTETPTDTPIPTSTPTSTPSETAVPTPTCVGDCNGEGHVTVDEILTLVNIALGNADATACPNGIPSGVLQVDVVLILTAVNNALDGCPLTPEQGCLTSGGTVTTATCCASASDFPDTCAIGACGCPPDTSHEVRVCTCGTGCFNGSRCVEQ